MALTESWGATGEQGKRRTKMEPGAAGAARKGTGGLDLEMQQKRQRGWSEVTQD